MKEDDFKWPEPDRVGRQELEIVMGNEHISFATSKIGSLVDVQSSDDPEGLRIFYYLVQVTSLFLYHDEFIPKDTLVSHSPQSKSPLNSDIISFILLSVIVSQCQT